MKLHFKQPDHWGNLNNIHRKNVLHAAISSIKTNYPPLVFYTDEHLLICFGNVSKHWGIVDGYIQSNANTVYVVFSPKCISIGSTSDSLKIQLDWSTVRTA
jgi:hypothetical protein